MPQRKTKRSEARQDQFIRVAQKTLTSFTVRILYLAVRWFQFSWTTEKIWTIGFFMSPQWHSLNASRPNYKLRHAAVALAGRASAEYHSFVAVTAETKLS